MTRETTEERTRKRWKQALDVFDEAFLLAPTERERLIESACRQDPELRPLLNDLFSASRDAESGRFLDSPAWTYQPLESNPRALEGKRIGAYRLKKYLARGGMGVVYLAERADKVFRREVAIKFITTNTKLKHFSRFRREVQILADLKHPNLVLLYDAGRLGDGRPYLVMEYVEGETLREWTEKRGPVPPPLVAEIVKQICNGLHAAHQAGVIHRDIKPANIVINESGGKLSVKVLDFGVAARHQPGDSGVTTTKGAVGTLLYMSPEQLKPVKGKDLTPASDIYALALTVYELLTGSPANDGQSQGEIILKHLEETPEPPSHRRPDLGIPPSFDRAIMKSLAKAPSDRHQSAPEFAAALEEVFKQKTADWNQTTDKLRDRPVTPAKSGTTDSTKPPTIPAPPIPPPVSPNAQPAPPVVVETKKSASSMKIVLAAAGVVAAVAIAIAAYSFRPVPISPATAPTPTATPAPVTGLKLKLAIKRPKDMAFNYCRFALFKPEVKTLPATVTPENALIIREEINSQGSSKTVKEQRVPPGNYLVSLECPGFKPFAEQVNIVENPHFPGWAIVPLRLEPK
ncbi:MAG TPA: serine/threonine-protein kinase [Blastocatellia bacterium]|nr:serine/threonine-protein kinase [Blastocatellia bacterium]HMV82710.1 serine/threonine-protein kinase [Blastocatellia bacterium]HMX27443.1 serine/threonine-protein kinase [Blastocatellia bacterium]HMY73299.1 serine/threonine-protein kinase [Blastocatellia bacterium]HMZ22807.1 serine/threonine-protein kinase [Blastocatellia bacterium]